MSNLIRYRVTVEVKPNIVIELTEPEARALEGLFGYGVDSFLKVFYEKMGRTYLEPHESGIRSLHDTIRAVVSGPLAECQAARQRIAEAMKGNSNV